MAMAVAAGRAGSDVRALESAYIARLLSDITFGTPLIACRSEGFEYRGLDTGAAPSLRDPATITALDMLETDLDERPLLITALPGPLLQTRPGGVYGIKSRHGWMVQSPDQPLPHHTILLVGSDRGRLVHLDPYYPAEQQPFSISRAEFVYAWIGEWAYWPQMTGRL